MATLDNVSIAKPIEAQGYLVAAQGMLAGAQPLDKVQPIPAIALTLLFGHACEAELKALLAQSGMSAAILSRVPYGHDILYLWQSAENNGHPIPSPQPDWGSSTLSCLRQTVSITIPTWFSRHRFA